jgi:hypothetical protein
MGVPTILFKEGATAAQQFLALFSIVSGFAAARFGTPIAEVVGRAW